MEGSNLRFMSCEELKEAFNKCADDVDKRILIIDVRDSSLYERSHLCLDGRNSKSSIRTKMRVMNINPDLISAPTSKNIMSILKEDDLNIFKKRKDATDVVIIDRNTDNISELSSPSSKVMRIINALTRYDSQPGDKIVVPIHILKGGYREWLFKYPHFNTDPHFNPDANFETRPPLRNHNNHKPNSNTISVIERKTPSSVSPISPPITKSILTPSSPSSLLNIQVQPPQPPAPKPAITKPVPAPPIKPSPIHQAKPTSSPSKPSITKNAPGTAVPVTPMSSVRSTLPRSHSSPNVAQADGDELDEPPSQLDKLTLSTNHVQPVLKNMNNNLIISPAIALTKPRFDRTLKPALNNENVNAIRAQLNFGRSPESSGKAITGLQNLGNTCFMNSVIQCLSYATTLVSYFCSDSYYNHINFNSTYGSKGEIAVEFGALVEKLNAHKHRYIEPKSFREAVIKHIGFAGNEQQDSHEFMMMLFDKLHHDLNIHAKSKQNGIVLQHNQDSSDNINLNIPKATLGYQFWRRHLDMNKSIISDLFEGIFMSTLTCTYCKGQSNTFEVFNCLSLPIPSETRCHIRDCLNHFSNPERIEAAWECPRCKQKREADKKIVICKLPKILIIHLKRFSLDGRWRQKLQTTVDFPLADLSVNCTNVLPQSAYGPTPFKGYNLYAVVNHYGHLDGGHYTAFCKMANQKWYTFDDSNVSEMKDVDVCGQAAYILFYSAGF